MKISYNWLQTYFDDKLPAPEKLAEMLTLRAYEVERIEKAGDDFVFEIDVLPNRAHDSLCHRGVAREIASIFGIPVHIPKRELLILGKTAKLSVVIEDGTTCRRYLGRVIEGVKVGPSQRWLVERLESVGQKSINNIVDVANYVMLDMGQPMHAFDAGKLAKENEESHEIIVRNAKSGEKIATLDGKDIALDESMLVIADAEDALAIAGVKGGLKAQVDERTTAIILEAANFHPTLVRKVSQKTGIRTDSSKRFENEISPELAAVGIKEAARLIADMTPEGIAIGEIVDEFPAQDKFSTKEVLVRTSEVSDLIGALFTRDDIENILKKLGWAYRALRDGKDAEFTVMPPPERQDITIKQDVIEEIGRVYGYENISPTLPEVTGFTAQVNKEFYYANKARDILAELGFSEVETSSFSAQGKIAIENPIADGKEFLRESLLHGITKSIELNNKNAPLLGLDSGSVKLFEIGNVFAEESEHTELALACRKGDMKKEIEKFFEKLGVEDDYKVVGDIAIINFTELLEKYGGEESYDDTLQIRKNKTKYQKISPYPFIVRDIALFVPEKTKAEEISQILTKNSGVLLARPPKLFDKFQKEGSGKISYAFRLVFQSQEKTLTDEESNAIMQKITAVLGENGWEVR